MVNYKKILEKQYFHTCNIYKQIEQENPTTFETEFINQVYIENQPCKLSYGSSNTTTRGDVAEYTQSITLFISKDIEIEEGSYIEVDVYGSKTVYKNSGKPKIYPYHQEIELEVQDEA